MAKGILADDSYFTDDTHPLFNTLRVLLIAFVAIIISSFKAFMEIVWGIAGLFLLAGLIAYFKVDTSMINPVFFKIGLFISQNFIWFFIAFFIYFMWVYFKEMNKDE